MRSAMNIPAKVEDQRLIDFGKVALLVEVGGIGDDPPPGLLAVHVVEVVPTTKNALRADRLDQRHRIVSRRLALDVLADGAFIRLR